MENNMEKKVREVIVQQTGCADEDVKPTATLVEDLGFDDLDLVELAMALEEVYGIDIGDEDAEGLKTVQDVLDYLHKRTAK